MVVAGIQHGKALLAKRVPTILPMLPGSLRSRSTRICGSPGRLDPGQPLMAARPFRSPERVIGDVGLFDSARPGRMGGDQAITCPLARLTGYWFGAVSPSLLRVSVAPASATKRRLPTCLGHIHLGHLCFLNNLGSSAPPPAEKTGRSCALGSP